MYSSHHSGHTPGAVYQEGKVGSHFVGVHKQRWDWSFITVAVMLVVLALANFGMNIAQVVQLGNVENTEQQILTQIDGHLPNAVFSMDKGAVTTWTASSQKLCTVSGPAAEAGLVEFDMSHARTQAAPHRSSDGTVANWAGTRTPTQLAQDYTYSGGPVVASAVYSALHSTSSSSSNGNVVLLLQHGSSKGTPVTISSVNTKTTNGASHIEIKYSTSTGTCYLPSWTSPHSSAAPIFFVALS